MGDEGGQDFGLLPRRDLEEIQGPSELAQPFGADFRIPNAFLSLPNEGMSALSPEADLIALDVRQLVGSIEDRLRSTNQNVIP